MNTEVMFSSKTYQWATPQDFFDKLNKEFHFTYQENKDRKATWGLRKTLQIIDKRKAESEEKNEKNTPIFN